MRLPTLKELRFPVACAAIALAFVESNVVFSRYPLVAAASAESEHELTSEEKGLLAELESKVSATLLLARGDARRGASLSFLEELQRASPFIAVASIDPERQKGEYLKKLGEQSRQDEAPLLVLERGDKQRFVELDTEKFSRETLRSSLFTSLASLLREADPIVCFVSGHGERSPFDHAPGGLFAFATLLERAGARVELVTLEEEATPVDSEATALLSTCESLVLAGADRPLSERAQSHLLALADGRRRLALFLDPVVDTRGHLGEGPAAALEKALQIQVPAAVLLEGDGARIPSREAPETFFANLAPHPLLQPLTQGAPSIARGPLVGFTREIRPGNAAASILLSTSPSASRLSNLNEGRGTPLGRSAHLGVLLEGGGGFAKTIVFGTSTLVDNAHLTDPTLESSRAFARRIARLLLDQVVPETSSAPAVTSPFAPWSSELQERARSWATLGQPILLALTGLLYFVVRARRNPKEGR